jgi:hypothetical protein
MSSLNPVSAQKPGLQTTSRSHSENPSRFCQSKVARNALFSSALRPEVNLFWFREFRVIRVIRLMPGI